MNNLNCRKSALQYWTTYFDLQMIKRNAVHNTVDENRQIQVGLCQPVHALFQFCGLGLFYFFPETGERAGGGEGSLIDQWVFNP